MEHVSDDELAALAAEAEAADLSRINREDLAKLHRRLFLALQSSRGGPFESRIENAYLWTARPIGHTHEHETRIPQRIEKLEKKIEGLEQTAAAFVSLRKWATGIFGTSLVLWVLYASRGAGGVQDLLILGAAIVAGLIWWAMWWNS